MCWIFLFFNYFVHYIIILTIVYNENYMELWNLVPKDFFGGMSTVTAKTWTLYTIQCCGHPVPLTITM